MQTTKETREQFENWPNYYPDYYSKQGWEVEKLLAENIAIDECYEKADISGRIAMLQRKMVISDLIFTICKEALLA